MDMTITHNPEDVAPREGEEIGSTKTIQGYDGVWRSFTRAAQGWVLTPVSPAPRAVEALGDGRVHYWWNSTAQSPAEHRLGLRPGDQRCVRDAVAGDLVRGSAADLAQVRRAAEERGLSMSAESGGWRIRCGAGGGATIVTDQGCRGIRTDYPCGCWSLAKREGHTSNPEPRGPQQVKCETCCGWHSGVSERVDWAFCPGHADEIGDTPDPQAPYPREIAPRVVATTATTVLIAADGSTADPPIAERWLKP